jgi:uncharacterized protein YcaQ
MESLTNLIARTLTIQNQGLTEKGFGKGTQGTLSAIEHLGYVQIDTLSVVARAHHHTLWSRVPDYQETYLNELLERKNIFEYWSHAASYLPMRDYRFYLPQKKSYIDGRSHWFAQDKKMIRFVYDRIKAEGALQSRDFEHKRTSAANWYEWKPAKRALEQLFLEGRLMVVKRQGFQKVYDLTERVLPPDVNVAFPSPAEYAEHLILSAVRAHGIVNKKEIVYLLRDVKDPVSKAITKLLQDGSLLEVWIKGNTEPYLTSTRQLEDARNFKKNNGIHILSPFDNMAIKRKRLQTLFGFDFMIECYLPEPKRKYGYFSLPVLAGDSFIGRFDPKADRASQTFYLKKVFFEPGFKPTKEFNKAFALRLNQFAKFNGCKKIVVGQAEAKWKKEFTSIIKQL